MTGGESVEGGFGVGLGGVHDFVQLKLTHKNILVVRLFVTFVISVLTLCLSSPSRVCVYVYIGCSRFGDEYLSFAVDDHGCGLSV